MDPRTPKRRNKFLASKPLLTEYRSVPDRHQMWTGIDRQGNYRVQERMMLHPDKFKTRDAALQWAKEHRNG